MNRNKTSLIALIGLLSVLVASAGFAQKPYRVGTTVAPFLEVGVGGAGSAMGDAYVSVASDISSIYWNPAGLAFMKKSEAAFSHQPWVADIGMEFSAVGLVLPTIGTLAFGITYMGFGEMDVTSMDYTEGTGERFNASDFAFSVAYARRLATWFSFGAAGKMINSRIWHCSGTAMAADLGVQIHSGFFSPTGNKEDGMKIGMSISNYGSRMQYDGMDLLQPIDIDPTQVGGFRNEGNYADSKGKFDLGRWELPLIFRIGVSANPIASKHHRLTVAVDALHPNNNQESVNVGGQYMLSLTGLGEFYVRGGYKALFMKESQYGATFGAGMVMRLPGVAFKIDYAYRSLGILGNPACYSFGVMF